MFDEEGAPEELTQVRMGKIVKDKYPNWTNRTKRLCDSTRWPR